MFAVAMLLLCKCMLLEVVSKRQLQLCLRKQQASTHFMFNCCAFRNKHFAAMQFQAGSVQAPRLLRSAATQKLFSSRTSCTAQIKQTKLATRHQKARDVDAFFLIKRGRHTRDNNIHNAITKNDV